MKSTYSRVRQTFHNQKLFEPTLGEKIIAKTAVVGRRMGRVGLNASMVAAVLVLVLYFLPGLVLKFVPGLNQTRVLGESVAAEGEVTQLMDAQVLWQPQLVQGLTTREVKPKYDFNAEEGKWLRSSTAEIEAEIFTNEQISNKKEVNAILNKGLYLYPEYAGIGEVGKTTIIAGHHYNSWMSPKASKKSFQNLDKLKVGDKVEIVDDFKIWTYEVTKVEQASEISEATADLIMYTCVFWWDSDLRLFVYAKLVE